MSCENVFIINSDGELENTLNNYTSVFSKYISSSAGRQRLAHAIMQPFHRKMDFQRMERKIFLVEQLPEAALPIYDKEPK